MRTPTPHTLTFSHLALLLVAASSLVAGEAQAKPFAPVPTLTPGYKDAGYRQIVAGVKKKMPAASKIEAPAYPGAITMNLSAGLDGSLPSIILLSSDPKEKVVAFYKEALKGWNFAEQFGFAWVFWKGKGEVNMNAPKVPHVVIMEANGKQIDAVLFSKMQTNITFYYLPSKRAKPKAVPGASSK